MNAGTIDIDFLINTGKNDELLDKTIKKLEQAGMSASEIGEVMDGDVKNAIAKLREKLETLGDTIRAQKGNLMEFTREFEELEAKKNSLPKGSNERSSAERELALMKKERSEYTGLLSDLEKKHKLINGIADGLEKEAISASKQTTLVVNCFRNCIFASPFTGLFLH